MSDTTISCAAAEAVLASTIPDAAGPRRFLLSLHFCERERVAAVEETSPAENPARGNPH